MPGSKSASDDEIISSIGSKISTLSSEGKIKLLFNLAKDLKESKPEGKEIRGDKEIAIPVGIFSNDSLGSLEAIVKYLREGCKLKFSRIAKLLNRSNKTIWATYHNASRKMPSPFENLSLEAEIPVSAISDRSFSTLESVVGFIKGKGYSNHEVAAMLHRDDRTIWAVYDSVKKKRGMKK